VSDGIVSEDFQDKVLDFELKAIATDKRVLRGKNFDGGWNSNYFL